MRLQRKRTIRSGHRSGRRAGTELLELGLILGLILLPILFGTIEFGTYFYVEHNLQGAAREAARAACVLPESEWGQAVEDAVTRVKENSSLSQFEGLNPDYEYEKIIENDVQYISVTVSTTWDQIPQGLRPLLMIRNAENHELKGYAVMRWEHLESEQ